MRAAEYSTGALKQYQDNLGSNGALEHFRKDMHRLFNAGFVAWRADDKSCTTQAFWDSKHPRAGYDFGSTAQTQEEHFPAVAKSNTFAPSERPRAAVFCFLDCFPDRNLMFFF